MSYMNYSEGMFKDDVFKGKVIIVTGGGTGLGKSMATYFSKLGASVMICSRKIEVLKKAAEEIHELSGNKVLPLACDVRDYDQVNQVIKTTQDTLGPINILLNNAAGNFVSPTERLSHRAFDTVVDIVLKGTYNFTLCMGKGWIAQKKTGTHFKYSYNLCMDRVRLCCP